MHLVGGDLLDGGRHRYHASTGLAGIWGKLSQIGPAGRHYVYEIVHGILSAAQAEFNCLALRAMITRGAEYFEKRD